MSVAETISSWVTTLNSILIQCNSKITAKNGTAASTLSGLPAAIDTVQGGADTSDATASAANVLYGKTYYGSSGKATGTMVNNGAVSFFLDGIASNSATIPEGYHSGSGKVVLNDNIKNEVASQKTLIQEITSIINEKANAYPTITYDSSTGTLTITEV